jgi:Zn-dependent protease
LIQSGGTGILVDNSIFLVMAAILSIGLGIFNLIPFPPLDGSKILGSILPDRLYYTILRYEQIDMFVLMALL